MVAALKLLAGLPAYAGTWAAYINFLTQDETDRTAFAYGPTYKRLVELKKRYDPTNFFQMNQNIQPG